MARELYRRKIADLHLALQEPETKAEAAELTRPLVEAIVLRPEGKGFEIELRGKIARMLPVATTKPPWMGWLFGLGSRVR